MLVLSRGRNDKVVFPTLGITVEVLRVEGRNVRLGIDAPKAVPILREEIAHQAELGGLVGNQSENGGLTHAMRNRLQKATLGLRMLQRMLDAGNASDAEPTIFKIFTELKEIEDNLGQHRVTRGAPTNSRGRRALVVEDDANERELLAGYLRLSGFDVDTAMDGLQAMVHLAKSDRPDVVLLDMKMPRFDGHKTVSAIRQNPDHKTLKIFAVTGTHPVEAAVDVGPDGVDRWFTKPVDPEQLVHAMQADLTQELVSA